MSSTEFGHPPTDPMSSVGPAMPGTGRPVAGADLPPIEGWAPAPVAAQPAHPAPPVAAGQSDGAGRAFDAPEVEDWSVPQDESDDEDLPVFPAAALTRQMSVPAGQWRLDANGTKLEPHSAVDVLFRLDEKITTGQVGEYQPIALGFTPLDKALGGGIRAGELLLIGGAQGTGKTTMSLQMARNMALAGQANVLYVCFEHDDEYLLNRLIALESAIDGLPSPTAAVRLNEVRREVLATWLAQGAGESADLATNPRLRVPLERIRRYGQSLFMMRGSQTATTLDNLHRLIEMHRQAAPDRQLVVFIDYLQKMPVIPDPATETERVTVVVNGLKDIALTHSVGMVSIVAADKDGLKASRLRNHHLRGSSAINYEADVILILNEKYNIVAKVNIEFNPYQAQRFRDWIVLTVEKNRSGMHSVDFEFQKHFAHACFDPAGRSVQEKLIEERLYSD